MSGFNTQEFQGIVVLNMDRVADISGESFSPRAEMVGAPKDGRIYVYAGGGDTLDDVVGTADIHIVCGIGGWKMLANIKLHRQVSDELVPSVEGTTLEKEGRQITKFSIKAIRLGTGNVDKRIKSLKEQVHPKMVDDSLTLTEAATQRFDALDAMKYSSRRVGDFAVTRREFRDRVYGPLKAGSITKEQAQAGLALGIDLDATYAECLAEDVGAMVSAQLRTYGGVVNSAAQKRLTDCMKTLVTESMGVAKEWPAPIKAIGPLAPPFYLGTRTWSAREDGFFHSEDKPKNWPQKPDAEMTPRFHGGKVHSAIAAVREHLEASRDVIYFVPTKEAADQAACRFVGSHPRVRGNQKEGYGFVDAVSRVHFRVCKIQGAGSRHEEVVFFENEEKMETLALIEARQVAARGQGKTEGPWTYHTHGDKIGTINDGARISIFVDIKLEPPIKFVPMPILSEKDKDFLTTIHDERGLINIVTDDVTPEQIVSIKKKYLAAIAPQAMGPAYPFPTPPAPPPTPPARKTDWPPLTTRVCECGSDKAGLPTHSTWCPKVMP